ncbi:hypothetical protein ABT299_30225 [Spirillospora sp. NPDC000708]
MTDLRAFLEARLDEAEALEHDKYLVRSDTWISCPECASTNYRTVDGAREVAFEPAGTG